VTRAGKVRQVWAVRNPQKLKVWRGRRRSPVA